MIYDNGDRAVWFYRFGILQEYPEARFIKRMNIPTNMEKVMNKCQENAITYRSQVGQIGSPSLDAVKKARSNASAACAGPATFATRK